MGLFDNLFKSKPSPAEEKLVETPPKPEEAANPPEAPAKSGANQRPADFLHPKNFVPRATPPSVPTGRAVLPPPPLRQPERKPAAPSGPPKDEIVLTLGDVLSRIPTHYLKIGLHDPKREMRFHINDLSSDIARGRAAVPLSRIAKLLPDIFVKEITPDEDTEIRLPLQKLVEQIGLLRSRPVPVQEKTNRLGGQIAQRPEGVSVETFGLPKEELAPVLGSMAPKEQTAFFQELNSPVETTAKLDLAPQPAAPAKVTLPSSALWMQKEATPSSVVSQPPQELRPAAERAGEIVPALSPLAPVAAPASVTPVKDETSAPVIEPVSVQGGTADEIRPVSEPARVSDALALPVVPPAAVKPEMPFLVLPPENPKENSPVTRPAFEKIIEAELIPEAAEPKLPEGAPQKEEAIAFEKPMEAPTGTLQELGRTLEIGSEAGRPSVVSLPAPVLHIETVKKDEVTSLDLPGELPGVPTLELDPEHGLVLESEPKLHIYSETEPIFEPKPAPNFPPVRVESEVPAVTVVPSTALSAPVEMETLPEPVSLADPATPTAAAAPVEMETVGPKIAPEGETVEKPEAHAPPQSTAHETPAPQIVIEWPSLEPASVEPAATIEHFSPSHVEPAAASVAGSAIEIEVPAASSMEAFTPPAGVRTTPAPVESGLVGDPPKSETPEIHQPETTAPSQPVSTVELPLVSFMPPDSPLTSAPVPAAMASENPAPVTPVAPAAPVTKEPEEEHGEEQIQLSLAAILRTCPPEIVVGPLPQVADNVRIKLPFAPIDRQLVKGHVEVSAMRFVAALPVDLQKHFSSRIGVRVPLPLEEIFQNLPGANAPAAQGTPPPVIPRPVTVNPESVADSSLLGKSSPVLSSAPGVEIRGIRWEPPSVSPLSPETSTPEGITLEPETHEPAAAPEAEAAPVAEVPVSVPVIAPEAHLAPESQPLLEGAVENPPSISEPVASAPMVEPVSPKLSVDLPKPSEPAPVAETVHSHELPSILPPVLPQLEATITPEGPAALVPPLPDLDVPAVPAEETAPAASEEAQADLPAPVPAAAVSEPSSPSMSSASESPSAEPPKLVLQPQMFRPMVLPPPPIFGYQPTAEETPAAEASAPPEAAPAPANPVATEPPVEVAPPEAKVEIAATKPVAAPEAPLDVPGVQEPLVAAAPSVEAPAVVELPKPEEQVAAVGETKLEASVLAAEEPPRVELAPSTPEIAPAVEPPQPSPVPVEAAAGLPPLFVSLASPSFEPLLPSAGPASTVPDINDAAAPLETAAAMGSLSAAVPPEGRAAVAETAEPQLPPPGAPPETNAEIAAEPSENAPSIPFYTTLEADEISALAVPPPPLFAMARPTQHVEPDEILPPPALPLTRFDQDALQALFMTEETLDLPKVSRLAASLPGVHACVIATRDQAVTGGKLPEGFDLAALLGLAPRVGEAAGRMPIGALKHFTLYGEHYSVSFFERNGLSLCAVHRPRSFVPGVREKLVAIADELSKS